MSLQEKIKDLKKQYGLRNLILFVLLLVGIAMIHTLYLGTIPRGINIDEMGMGYDAWCLANFGVDRYLNSFPLYFINFAAGQSVMYGYICMIFVKIFGLSVWTIRMPAVVFVVITVVYGIKLTALRYQGNFHSILLFLSLYMVCPVFLFLSRIGLDCNLMLGMSTVFLYYLFVAVEKEKYRWYFFAGVMCGFVLYTYVLSYLVLPIFLFGMLVYLIYLKKINWKQFMVFTIPLAILGAPLVVIQLIQMLNLSEMQIGIFTLPKLFQYRANELSLEMIGENLKGMWKVIFLYDTQPYDSVATYGNLYYISIPFLIVGFFIFMKNVIGSIRTRIWNIQVPLFLWGISMLLMGLTMNSMEIWIYRFNAIYLVILFILMEGIIAIYYFVKGKAKRIYVGVTVLVYGICFISFINYYFTQYPEDFDTGYFFNYTFEEAIAYLEEIDSEIGERTTYVHEVNQAHIYYLGATLLSPYDYNVMEIEDSEHLTEWANYYKNYSFVLSETWDFNGNYIINKGNLSLVQDLEEMGFQSVQKGNYYVLTHPWSTSYLEDNQTLSLGWDAGVFEDSYIDLSTGTDINGVNSIVIVGWTYDNSSEKLWDDIFLQVGEQTYKPELVERDDIVEAVGIESVLNCGLLFIIPVEELSGYSEAELITINCEGEVYTRTDITISS